MRFSVGPLSRSIKVISAAVIFLDAGLIVPCFLTEWAFVPASLLVPITLGCYLHAPVAYEVTPNGLTIVFRVGYRRFGTIKIAGRVEEPGDRIIRLCGNGGLFAAKGIFWNRAYGFFRAYSRPR